MAERGIQCMPSSDISNVKDSLPLLHKYVMMSLTSSRRHSARVQSIAVSSFKVASVTDL